jgi:Replication-relaxation
LRAPSPTNPPRLGAGGVEILESLYQHRLLRTRQVHELHAPDASRRRTQELLSRLRVSGLAEMARDRVGGGAWYLTPAGLEAAETITSRAEQRRKLVTPAAAAGPLQEHTLAVNEVGLAFVRAARERADDCGPFAWRHEIAHPLGPAPGRRRSEQLIADALLTYQQEGGIGDVRFHYRFVELDRATMAAADLSSKLARYARLHRRTAPAEDPLEEPAPLWSLLYPVFPAVLVVLAGRGREALERRRATVLALVSEEPELAEDPEVEISLCLLEDLVERGPFASICLRPAAPGSVVDWLGEGR